MAAFIGNAYGQNADWVEMMNDPSVNFYRVQESFETYWKERQLEKGKGWKQFKRWEAFMEPRVYPEGIRPNPSVLAQAQSFVQQNYQNENYGQWTPMGPYNGVSMEGVGRINAIAFDPVNADVIWAGAPAGGLWKSTDRGATWSTTTDQLVNLGISQIVIDPQNTDIMYLATGDNDGGDTYSYGVLKSTDGGNSWKPTGLSMAVSQQIRISDLWIHPEHPDTLIATTRSGIFRTTNAGQSWSMVRGGSYNRLTQKAGNPDVLFTSSLGSSVMMYRSEDNGLTWNGISDPVLPTGRRVEIETTPDDTNYVYALFGASDNGFGGLYLSTDGGDTWQQQATSPNLLGWQTSGNDNGGQAWYDLELAVDPTNKNRVFVGGVNIWTSNTAGISWGIASHWYGGGGNPFVHADVHELKFHPLTQNLYAATDGGVYRDMPNQHHWDALNDGMNITQYYGFDNAGTDSSLIIAGAQDNGTHLMDAGSWDDVRGGDGMLCFIDPKNPNVMYSSVYYGEFRKSTNRGVNFFANFNLPPAGSGNWVTPFLVDPQHPDTLYAGFSKIWRSYDGGQSFSATTAITGNAAGSNLDKLAIAPNHTNIIFASEGKSLWRSNDRGDNLSSLSVPGSKAISYIAVSPLNPDHVVVTKSGYSGGDKVYESFNRGNSWTNISSGLPNIPVNCVTFDDNSTESIYIGTDLGVFYRDNQQPQWLAFNLGLPNVIVNELKISPQNRKLRAATYGRGVWETPLYTDLVPPHAEAAFPASICVNDTFRLENLSAYNPKNISWSITPSAGVSFVNGSTASTRSPELSISQKGLYNVSLAVSNQIGEDSVFFTSALAVGGFPLPFGEDFNNDSDVKYWSAGNTPWDRMALNGNQVLRANLYQASVGKGCEIISPAIDLSEADSAWMGFDYAYSGRPANGGDSLLVYVASGCSANWQLLMALGEDGTQNFRTSAAVPGRYSPSAGDWCGSGMAPCPVGDLSPWKGQSGVRLKIVAVSGAGNDIYLDNFRVEGFSSVAPTAAFSLPTQICALDTLSLSDQSTGIPAAWEWSLTGPDSLSSTDRNPKLRLTQAGVYSVKLVVQNALGSDSLIRNSVLAVASADSVNFGLVYPNHYICTTDSLKVSSVSSNEGTAPLYTWYKNGQEVGKTSTGNFAYTGLANGDKLYASLQSDMACAFPAKAWSDSITAQVHTPVNLSLNLPYFACILDTAFPIQVAPAGGVLSGSNGIVNNYFDPASAGPGTHEIFYTYTDSNGCSYSTSGKVTVREPLNLRIVASPTYCEGDAYQDLKLILPLGGNYSGPGVYNNDFYPDSVATGTYVLTYSYPLPVCGTITKNVNVSVATRPAVPSLQWQGGGGLFCPDSAAAYQWYDSRGPISGATAQSFTPMTSDTFRVRVTNAAGCHRFSEALTYSIGLDEINVGARLRIYPNPATDQIQLQISDAPNTTGNLRIVNSLGAIVLSRQFTPENHRWESKLSLAHLPAGVYVLHLSGDQMEIRQPLVIQ